MNIFRKVASATSAIRPPRRYAQFIFVLMVFITPPVVAQQSQPVSPLDKAGACLQYAEFQQQRTLTGLPRPLVSQGRILLDCKRGTLWSTTAPIRETLVYTFGGKHWLIKPASEPQEIKNAAQKRIGDILSRLVRGDRAFIEKYFRQESTGHVIRLLPTQRRLKKYIENIDLEETSNGLRVVVARTDKQNMIIDVSSVRALASLDAQSCYRLLDTEQGCAQLFAADGN